MIRLLASVSISLLLSCPVNAEQAYQPVAEAIAQQGRNTVRFTEETVAFYLEEPLLSMGTMKFEPPDILIKIIEEPESIKQKITGDEVLVIRAEKEIKRFSLASHYGLEVMANTLRSLLSGEFSYLDSVYAIDFSEQGLAWRMKLVPLEEKLQAIVESVMVEGQGGQITEYTVTENNGDYTVTSLFDEDTR